MPTRKEVLDIGVQPGGEDQKVVSDGFAVLEPQLPPVEIDRDRSPEPEMSIALAA